MLRSPGLSKTRIVAALAAALTMAEHPFPTAALAQPAVDPFVSAISPAPLKPASPAPSPVARRSTEKPARSDAPLRPATPPVLPIAPAIPPAITLQPGWVADLRTGCRMWDPNITPDVTVTWTGPCQDGVASGKGIREWRDSFGVSRFEGSHENGRANGTGAMRWANGNFYEGEWVDGMRSGTGTMRWASGNSYTGQWANGQRSGRGVHTFTNGVTYNGSWSGDRPNGSGTVSYPNGGSYVGNWNNGCSSNGSQRVNFLTRRAECGF